MQVAEEIIQRLARRMRHLARVPCLQTDQGSFLWKRESLLEVIANHVCSALESTGAAISLLQGDSVVCCAVAGAAPELGTKLDVRSGLSGECFRKGKLIVCADTSSDARVNAAACRALNIRSMLATPVVDTDASPPKTIGVLIVLSDKPNHYSAEEEFIMQPIASIISQAARADDFEALSEVMQSMLDLPVLFAQMYLDGTGVSLTDQASSYPAGSSTSEPAKQTAGPKFGAISGVQLLHRLIAAVRRSA